MEFKPVIRWDWAEVVVEGESWAIKFRSEDGNDGVISGFKSRIEAYQLLLLGIWQDSEVDRVIEGEIRRKA